MEVNISFDHQEVFVLLGGKPMFGAERVTCNRNERHSTAQEQPFVSIISGKKPRCKALEPIRTACRPLRARNDSSCYIEFSQEGAHGFDFKTR